MTLLATIDTFYCVSQQIFLSFSKVPDPVLGSGGANKTDKCLCANETYILLVAIFLGK